MAYDYHDYVVLWQSKTRPLSLFPDIEYRIVEQGEGSELVIERRSTKSDSLGVMTTSWERLDRDFEQVYIYSMAIRELVKKQAKIR